MFALLRGVRLPLRLRRTLAAVGLAGGVAARAVRHAHRLPNGLMLVGSLAAAVIARPLASTVATIGQGFTPSERALLAWAGLRGAVPVVLVTFAVIDGVPRSVELLNIVFFAVLLSATLQAATVEALANRLLPRTADES